MKGICSSTDSRRGGKSARLFRGGLCLSALIGVSFALVANAEPGVSPVSIRIGGVMDLEGVSSGLGQGMKTGIEAATAAPSSSVAAAGPWAAS